MGNPFDNRPACDGRSGVTVFEPAKCSHGYTLCYSYTAESAQLVDMEGRVVHQWRYDQDILWHFAEMLPNGHLLVIPNTGEYSSKISKQMLLELDWDSNVIWTCSANAHHDAQRLDNGNTLVACHGRAHYNHLLPGRNMLYDYLQEITPTGDVVWEWHPAAHAEEFTVPVAAEGFDGLDDWPHINTVESLPDTALGRTDARFRAGNVLVSGRNNHTIWIVDRRTDQVAWQYGPGKLLGQHEPTMLENGNILIFDNGFGPPSLDRSRVVELDPLTGHIVWQYAADPPDAFFSPIGSGSQRLPNGNTLICAMNWAQRGRIFEVTPAGEIVWEFWNPEDLAFYRAVRYSPELIEALLGRP